MRGVLLAAALWGATCASKPVNDDQLVKTPVPKWFLLPVIEQKLAKHYRETQKDSLSLEYIACFAYAAHDNPDGTRFYLLMGIRFPDQEAWIVRDEDTDRIIAYRVAGKCDDDEIPVHTHSRLQCLAFGYRTCTASTDWREPSYIDVKISQHRPLSFIQYGERDFLGYAPDSVPRWALRIKPR